MMYFEVIKLFQENADAGNALQMANYQKNQFAFYGIQTPLRRQLSKSFLKTKALETSVDWEFVFAMWDEEHRECQYLACDYLKKVKQKLLLSDLEKIKILIITKSWWDTVDYLDEVVGSIAKNNPKAKKILLEWSLADNFWQRRLAIDHQLKFKEDTNKELLSQIIENNLSGSTFAHEFFVNKAIGWSLREYSKTNPNWVRQFIKLHKARMNQLSIREASKYL